MKLPISVSLSCHRFFGSVRGIFLLTMLLILAAACDTEGNYSRRWSGMLIPSLSIDPTIVDPDGTPIAGLISDIKSTGPISFSIRSLSNSEYSHTWPSVADYDVKMPLAVGSYLVSAETVSPFVNGFDALHFVAAETVDITDGCERKVDLVARPANSLVTIDCSNAAKTYFSQIKAVVHTDGAGFIDYPLDDPRVLYLQPGLIEVFADIEMADGRSTTVFVGSIRDSQAAHIYPMTIGVDASASPAVLSLTLLKGEGQCLGRVELSDEFWAQTSPLINVAGVSPSGVVSVHEGVRPESPVVIDASGNDLVDLTLSTEAPSLIDAGWPTQIDLISDEALPLLQQWGVSINISPSGAQADVTNIITALRHVGTLADNRFYIVARDSFGHISKPYCIDPDVLPVDLSISSAQSVSVGQESATLIVSSAVSGIADNITLSYSIDGEAWQPVEIQAIDYTGSGNYSIIYRVPSLSRAYQIRAEYCGAVEDVASVARIAPEFTISVDAFARNAIVRVNPAVASQLSDITSLVKVYANDKSVVVTSRDPQKGLIHITNLSSSKSYTFKASLFEEPTAAQFSNSVTVKTESQQQLPNTSFEDVLDEVLKYRHMPQGGRYSQSVVEIFNLQNYTNFKITLPEKWATTNAKTFNTSAANVNTWYVVPSVMSSKSARDGGFAVKLQSVAWDPRGEKIPDYLQESKPYVKYSRNVPNIRYRAAGKIFLGSYKFNASKPSETYTQGVKFASRPSALNGFYKFVPSQIDPSDCGLVKIELLGSVNGESLVIASASLNLLPTMGYAAFNLPIEYPYFGVKAHSVRVMISSSKHIGDIEYETLNIATQPDPTTATSIGGVLWIDGLSLSY